MKKTLQIWMSFIFILFIFPVVLQFLPKQSTNPSTFSLKEPSMIVYASNVLEEDMKPKAEGRVLIYSAHSHEAYEPITKAVNGKVTASHHSENILKMGARLKDNLLVHGITAEQLDIDITKIMQQKKIPYHRSYGAIRPYVEEKVRNQQYDLVIDLHRDSLGPARTTITHGGQRYAKIAFVIGREHPYYDKNLTKAKQLKNELEKRVPGITRDIIIKGGRGVDGKYNQDLDTSMILVELGGVGNTEVELNQSLSVIGESISTLLMVQ
ncbi:stage II sporulation protein P [Sporosarcina sp. GW1-11]|uniref:stage II sporulation protein P n=1 Tax=Sporosarcina sp. GW1-11 TaxID=2899126 RepID=UPI00294C6E7A|nr:stage II sporulation protein P [Sporosarcina sp. GW1-11]MDV6377960.1 stage II sporulation protein P [Sporosarcina sp. GW1-11]